MLLPMLDHSKCHETICDGDTIYRYEYSAKSAKKMMNVSDVKDVSSQAESYEWTMCRRIFVHEMWEWLLTTSFEFPVFNYTSFRLEMIASKTVRHTKITNKQLYKLNNVIIYVLNMTFGTLYTQSRRCILYSQEKSRLVYLSQDANARFSTSKVHLYGKMILSFLHTRTPTHTHSCLVIKMFIFVIILKICAIRQFKFIRFSGVAHLQSHTFARIVFI